MLRQQVPNYIPFNGNEKFLSDMANAIPVKCWQPVIMDNAFKKPTERTLCVHRQHLLASQNLAREQSGISDGFSARSAVKYIRDPVY